MEFVESEVTQASFRHELICDVAELATGCLGVSETPVGSRFLEIHSLLLDEAEIGGDLTRAIGTFLRNDEEARSLERLSKPLRMVFMEVGADASDAVYVDARSWPTLQTAARDALDVLRSDD